MTLADNLRRVQDRIAQAALRSARRPSDITLVAVGKTHPAQTIVEAFELGVRHFGENRAEEAAGKIPSVQSAIGNRQFEIIWHMIGHAQSRKAETVAGLFDWIHSVESIKLAHRLSRFAQEHDKRLKVLLEFNLSAEASKYGFRLKRDTLDNDTELLAEIAAIAALPPLQVEGLMTMAPIVVDTQQARPVFRALRELRDQLAVRFPHCSWRHLSMGMTDDFEVAIEEGATMVRIGRAIFGERRMTNAE